MAREMDAQLFLSSLGRPASTLVLEVQADCRERTEEPAGSVDRPDRAKGRHRREETPGVGVGEEGRGEGIGGVVEVGVAVLLTAPAAF